MKLENKLGIIVAGLIGLSGACKQEQTPREPTQDIECETVQAIYNGENEWIKTHRMGFGKPLRLCTYSMTSSKLLPNGTFTGIVYELEMFYEGKGWERVMEFSSGNNYVSPENQEEKQ